MNGRPLFVLLFVLVGAVLSCSDDAELTVLKPHGGGVAHCPHAHAPVCAAGCRETPLTTFKNLCFARDYSARHREALVVFKGRCPC